MKVESVDRLAWIKIAGASKTDLLELTDRLTVHTEDPITKAITSTRLFETKLDRIGIPRQFGKMALTLDDAIDCTIWEEFAGFPDLVFPMYPPQFSAATEFIEGIGVNGYGGIIQAKCGSGKTVTALGVASLLKVPTLILVHKSDLMNQWLGLTDDKAPDGKGYGIRKFLGLSDDKIGWVRQDTQVFEDRPITVALFQTIRARREELEAKGFFDRFSLVIIDECHHIPAVTFEEVIRLFSAKIRLGLTATPRRKDGLEKVFYWHIGEIITRIKSTMLTGDFVQKRYSDSSLKYKCGDNFGKAVTLISQDPIRNKLLLDAVLEAHAKDRRILILTDRTEQVDYFVDNLRMILLRRGALASVSPYVGGMKDEHLRDAKKSQIIVGTYGMLEEGTDVPDRDTLFLATPRGDIEQTVGRIQRVHEDKKRLVVYDVVDTGWGMFIALGKKRRSMLLEMEFKELR